MSARFSSSPSNSLFRAYWREFSHFDPPALHRALFLNLAAAATEGAGLLMLLPLLAWAGVLGSTSASMPFAWMLKSSGGQGGLAQALGAFVTLVALQGWLTLWRDRVCHTLQLRFTDHLRQSLYAALAGARWRFLLERHSGECLNALTTEVQRVGTGTHFLLRLITVSILTLAYSAVALQLSPALTALALATGLVLGILMRKADAASRNSGVLLGQANRHLFVRTQDFLSTLKLVKIHGEEARDVQQFNQAADAVSARFIEFNTLRTWIQWIFRVGGATALALLCYAALMLIHLETAQLLVMIAIFSRMLPQLAEILSGRQHLLHMLPAFATWQQWMTDARAHPDTPSESATPTPLKRAITLEDVHFRHPGSHHTLSVEQLRLPVGTTTAIVGASGAGKTTLLDLLSGLLTPDAGVVRVDGRPLQTIADWRQGLAYLPQETFIRDGSVRDNLLWGSATPSEAEITQVLQQAALDALIQRLPQGLETPVGERGANLSGGERQRLALARALLRKPQLLILDEATSALDARNRQLIFDTLHRLHGSMTILIVTHRQEELLGLIDGVVEVQAGVVKPWLKKDN